MKIKYVVLGKNTHNKYFTLEKQCYTALFATICLWYVLSKYDIAEVRKV